MVVLLLTAMVEVATEGEREEMINEEGRQGVAVAEAEAVEAAVGQTIFSPSPD